MKKMGVSSTPVGAATTTPPTDGWEVFGQSMHGELRAYGTPLEENIVSKNKQLTISPSPHPCQ
jgi:hypothetical protein